MSKLHVTDRSVTIEFTLGERIAGLVRDQTIPLDAIESASVETEPLASVRGWRAPGLALPWRTKIGTWRSRDGRHLVCVRKGQLAVRLHTPDLPYRTYLIGDDDAAAVVARLGERGTVSGAQTP